ncbi:hypothetical protein BY996DRAFT_8245762 [Phakopsora pachyrhizi]|nr:hypothetical protein BY996DRAFT_8245762 [Phakopsora pachyrhizi]
MWSSNSNITTTSKRSTTDQPMSLESITGAISVTINSTAAAATSTSTTTSPETWRKDLKLGRVVNRDRKKLSTVTISSSSSGTTDSNLSIREPLTPPPDLPLLDGQLSKLEEKFEVVENQIVARKRMFDNLDKDSAFLNDELQKTLSSEKNKSPTYHISPIQPDQMERSKSEAYIKQDKKRLSSLSERRSSTLGDVTNSLEQPAANTGWGDYIKSFW